MPSRHRSREARAPDADQGSVAGAFMGVLAVVQPATRPGRVPLRNMLCGGVEVAAW